MLDIDYHHGNGTQEIFYNDASVLYCSLHADPDFEYPFFWGGSNETGDGSGLGFNHNWPLPLGTDEYGYLFALDQALAEIIFFSPKYLVVSLGFDFLHNDPATIRGGFNVGFETIPKIASKIFDLHLPTLIIQEGGYNIANLGYYAINFLKLFIYGDLNNESKNT